MNKCYLIYGLFTRFCPKWSFKKNVFVHIHNCAYISVLFIFDCYNSSWHGTLLLFYRYCSQCNYIWSTLPYRGTTFSLFCSTKSVICLISYCAAIVFTLRLSLKFGSQDFLSPGNRVKSLGYEFLKKSFSRFRVYLRN